MSRLKLAIIGSRTFTDKEVFSKCMKYLSSKYEIVQIISGGARGADTLGEQYADEHNIPKLIFYPDWDRFGKSAGFIRNRDIISNCNVCIAFWDGSSRGTQHDIQLCNELGKPHFVYNASTNKLMYYKV